MALHREGGYRGTFLLNSPRAEFGSAEGRMGLLNFPWQSTGSAWERWFYVGDICGASVSEREVAAAREAWGFARLFVAR